MNEEPKCKTGLEHSWQVLGKEDNRDLVHRCGNCLAMMYRAEDGTVRYEVPA